MIRVKLKRVVSNNVQRFFSGGNSYYEKFADRKVKCIDEEIPFEIPQGWEWARIRDISQSYIGLTYSPQNVSSEGTVVLRSSNIQSGQLDLNDIVRVNTKIPSKLYVEENDILICARNGSKKLVGKSAVIKGLNEPMTFGAFMAICKTPLWEYVFCFLQSDLFFAQLRDVSGTTTINQLTQNNFNAFLIPIPPIEEQKRITSKCNTILPFVETYGHQQKHLDSLNNDIKLRLRKSILQEAIQGKLVPHDPNDEPASVLLECVHAEKQKLLKEGKLKKKDFVDSVIYKGEDNKYYEKVGGKSLDINDDIPFDIPNTWVWVRLGSIVSNEAGLAYSKDCLADKTPPAIRVLRGGNIEEGHWAIKDDDVIISKKYVKESLLLRRGTFITPAVTSIERMAKTALIEEDQVDIVVGGFVLMMKPFITDDSLLQYLNLFFQTTFFKRYCISITNKSGQAFYNLSRQKLMQCFVPLPPEGEQVRIADKYSSLTL